MITVKDQVSMLYGRIIADDLDELGLLASDNRTDDVDEAEPTLWRVHVRKVGPTTYGHSGLASELRAVIYQGGHAEKSWTNETTARRQASMAKNQAWL